MADGEEIEDAVCDIGGCFAGVILVRFLLVLVGGRRDSYSLRRVDMDKDVSEEQSQFRCGMQEMVLG